VLNSKPLLYPTLHTVRMFTDCGRCISTSPSINDNIYSPVGTHQYTVQCKI
jgi:hypothetical protein